MYCWYISKSSRDHHQSDNLTTVIVMATNNLFCIFYLLLQLAVTNSAACCHCSSLDFVCLHFTSLFQMSTNGSSTGTEAPSDTNDKYQRTNSFKDSDRYVRTRSGTYVRRDSDSYNRKDSCMPDFR